MNSVSFLLIPADLFTVFFYYESDASVTSLGLSIVRSLYLYMYNAPVCLLALPFFGLVWYLHGLVLHSVISSVMVMVLIPIPIIIFAVLYTKQLHEQFEFYYFLKNSNDNKENV